MSDSNLNNPVRIQATRIDATLLPKEFSKPYMLYVVQQGSELGAVAGKANEAGQGAYDAQVKNEEQDKVLSNHDIRIINADKKIAVHENRITKAETDIADHDQRIQSAEIELSNHDSRIKNNASDISVLKNDYISKSLNKIQYISSPINITSYLSINGKKVIGEQQTGWEKASGYANKGAFNADQSYSAGDFYSKNEIQSIVKGLVEARQRIKALEDMARNHGLIL